MRGLSLARRHRDRCLAQAAAAVAATAPAQRGPQGPEATAYEEICAQLGGDLARLREIQSIEAKIALKGQLLPAYDAWVDGILAAGEGEDGVGAHDEILAQTMIWQLDVGNFGRGLELAGHMLRFGLALPERFTRTVGCAVAELIADAAIAALLAGEPFDLEIMLRAEELTAKEDMPDQVRAKLAKAIGLELERQADAIEEGGDGPAGAKRAALEGALARFKRALELDAKAGVKKRIERLVREVAKITVGQS